MKGNRLRIITENYSTYVDQRSNETENHGYRFALQAAISIVIAVFVNKLSDDSISVLVTALSILIGFAFAAMFPIALESVAGLPKPLYAEDRDDIRVIRQLAIYFRFNVAYFIPLALLTVAILLIQMLDFHVPNFIKEWIIHFVEPSKNAAYYVLLFSMIALKAVIAVTVFMIVESCYTFYRMCFNALALLRIKEEYITNRPE